MPGFARYRNKHVVVSGCFSGMGEATARLLLEAGARVHGLDYKECVLPLASFTHVDLRDPNSIDAAVAKLDGRIDALFNCAGLPQTFPAMDVMKVNFLGTRHLTQAVLKQMENGAAIVSISSTGGLGWSRRLPTHLELIATLGFEEGLKWCEAHTEVVGNGYAFSKEAVIVWTQFSAAHLITRGIRMNCTLPGPTQTPMMASFEAVVAASVLDAAAQPIGRRATPEEQAAPLLFLNSDAASYVNGVVLPVDGGFMGGAATGQVDLSRLSGATHR